MMPLRRWVPVPAREAIVDANRAAEPGLESAIRKNMAFCAEFALYGGVAVSVEGFRAEAELVRLQKAGLVDLERDPAAPFAVTKVTLSPAARALLSGRGTPAASAADATHTKAGKYAAPRSARQAVSTAGPTAERTLRRNGFEVARGMISAAVKAEVSSWSAQGEPGGTAAFESRLMARIMRLDCPFPT